MRERYRKDYLISALVWFAKKGMDAEVIVVDAASMDKTREVALGWELK